jgi:F-type H+-transporting ATPase subunit epsilon
VAALPPGILSYETQTEREVYIAIDEGVLVKTGSEVLVSVRNAIAGTDLHRLREAVDAEFLDLDEQERTVRAALADMEDSLISRMAAFQND